jgi:hypothetical protein
VHETEKCSFASSPAIPSLLPFIQGGHYSPQVLCAGFHNLDGQIRLAPATNKGAFQFFCPLLPFGSHIVGCGHRPPEAVVEVLEGPASGTGVQWSAIADVQFFHNGAGRGAQSLHSIGRVLWKGRRERLDSWLVRRNCVDIRHRCKGIVKPLGRLYAVACQLLVENVAEEWNR